MTKLTMVLAGMAVCGTIFAGNTCTWIGASGDWNDAANWQGGVKPTDNNGDTVVLACASAGAVISNNLGEITLANLTLETPNPVTLKGDAIRLTGTLLTHAASIVDNDLYVDGNCNLNCGEKTYNGDYRPTFNGAITIADGKNLYIYGNSGANFNGPVTGANAYVQFGPRQTAYRWDGGTYYFHGAVVVKEFQHYDYGMSTAYFYNSGNHWEKITHRYGANYNFYNDSMPHESVVDFISSGERRSQWRGLFLYGDVTLNRIDCTGTCPVVDYNGQDKRQYNWFRNNDDHAITMTLKATADARTSCSVRMNTHGINFVYDPVGNYVQEFTESFFNSATPLVVKGGTLKFSGDTLCQSATELTVKDGATFDLDVTSTEAFKNMTKVELGKGAVFKVGASAVTPFAKNPTVKMAAGSKMVLGAAIAVGDCFTPDGRVLASGTYTSSDCPWIEGAGSLTVTSTVAGDYVSWSAAVDGGWSEGAKWTGGSAPAAGKAVLVAANGADYKVSVSATPDAPTGLTVRNGANDAATTLEVSAPMTVNVTAAKPLEIADGGIVKIVAGGDFRPTANSVQANAVNVREGGTLEVAGGTLHVPNLTGRFNILGSADQEGLLKISSGTCTVSSIWSAGSFLLGEHGRLAMTGGVFHCPGYTSYYKTFEFAGGTLDLSGDAQFWTTKARTPYQGYGTINLSGNAQFCKKQNDADAWQGRVFFEPLKDSDAIEINVTEHAKYDVSSLIRTDLGGRYGGKVTMRLASDQTHHFGGWGYVGTGSGLAEVKLESGTLRCGTYGFAIGGAGDEERFSGPVHPKGRVEMTGGTLFVYADTASVLTKSPALGFLIGCCPVYANESALHGSYAEGSFEMSGGVVTNVYGFTHVGYGAAKGRVVQTGGFFGTANNLPATIGAYSGDGEWIVSNGTAQVRGQLYIGGVSSNDLRRLVDAASYPEGIAGSKGRLEVAGGTFNGWQLYAGLAQYNGSAEIEVGLAGELNTWSTVLDNAKLVRRIGDAGTGAFNISGDLTITANASLEVDATALADQSTGRFPLFTYTGSRTGDFDPEKVEMKGFSNPGKWILRWHGKQLECACLNGTTILFR